MISTHHVDPGCLLWIVYFCASPSAGRPIATWAAREGKKNKLRRSDWSRPVDEGDKTNSYVYVLTVLYTMAQAPSALGVKGRGGKGTWTGSVRKGTSPSEGGWEGKRARGVVCWGPLFADAAKLQSKGLVPPSSAPPCRVVQLDGSTHSLVQAIPFWAALALSHTQLEAQRVQPGSSGHMMREHPPEIQA